MVKVVKKNQVVMFVLALALVSAAYLGYMPNAEQNANYISTTLDEVENAESIGDATLVSSTAVIENIVKENEAKTAETAATVTQDDYFTNSKIERDKMYSQMLENYQQIIDNASISAEQKAVATKEITNINNTKNAIMIAENLIKTKGFDDVVIFVNQESVNVILKANEITSNHVAQVQNIIERELKAEVNNIHISTK